MLTAGAVSYGYDDNVDPTGLCPNGCESPGSIPGPPSAGECPVEPVARARCAHAFLRLLSQYIEQVVRPALDFLSGGDEGDLLQTRSDDPCEAVFSLSGWCVADSLRDVQQFTSNNRACVGFSAIAAAYWAAIITSRGAAAPWAGGPTVQWSTQAAVACSDVK